MRELLKLLFFISSVILLLKEGLYPYLLLIFFGHLQFSIDLALLGQGHIVSKIWQAQQGLINFFFMNCIFCIILLSSLEI